MELHDVQQNSPEWNELRAGLPTASDFGRLVTGTGKPSTQLAGYAALLAAEMFAGGPLERWGGNGATDRGHELEDLARANYEFQNDAEVERIGFVTNYGAGCSPDGFVGENGLHEIKCQRAEGHVQTMSYVNRHGKCPPAYYPQVQGQLLICEREWVDLDFYHPELPGVTIRIERDEPYIRELLRQIKAVIAERDSLVEMLRAA